MAVVFATLATLIFALIWCVDRRIVH